MRKKENKRSLAAVLRLMLFILLGAGIGLIFGSLSGFRWQPNDGVSLLITPIIVCSLNCAIIAWFTRNTLCRFQTILIIIFGLVVGTYVGAFFGGILGTILSIPFEAFWEPLFLTGNLLGAIIFGSIFPIGILNRIQNSKILSIYFKKSKA